MINFCVLLSVFRRKKVRSFHKNDFHLKIKSLCKHVPLNSDIFKHQLQSLNYDTKLMFTSTLIECKHFFSCSAWEKLPECYSSPVDAVKSHMLLTSRHSRDMNRPESAHQSNLLHHSNRIDSTIALERKLFTFFDKTFRVDRFSCSSCFQMFPLNWVHIEENKQGKFEKKVCGV